MEMVMEEPALPRPKRGAALIEAGREDLDPYALEELEARITQLELEIDRTRRAMDRKLAGRSVADSLFTAGRLTRSGAPRGLARRLQCTKALTEMRCVEGLG